MHDHRPEASPDHPDLRDYVGWHAAYDDPGSSLSVRLRYVQRAIVIRDANRVSGVRLNQRRSAGSGLTGWRCESALLISYHVEDLGLG